VRPGFKFAAFVTVVTVPQWPPGCGFAGTVTRTATDSDSVRVKFKSLAHCSDDRHGGRAPAHWQRHWPSAAASLAGWLGPDPASRQSDVRRGTAAAGRPVDETQAD
jgi:hypothetical protein